LNPLPTAQPRIWFAFYTPVENLENRDPFVELADQIDVLIPRGGFKGGFAELLPDRRKNEIGFLDLSDPLSLSICAFQQVVGRSGKASKRPESTEQHPNVTRMLQCTPTVESFSMLGSCAPPDNASYSTMITDLVTRLSAG
jgi:hypothetical protein